LGAAAAGTRPASLFHRKARIAAARAWQPCRSAMRRNAHEVGMVEPKMPQA